MKFREGITYLAEDNYLGKLPPLFRATVEDGLLVGSEVFSAVKGTWVFSPELRLQKISMGELDLVEVTPRLAEEIIEKRLQLIREKQAGEG